MGRRSQTRSLDVWMNGEPVGRWTITSQGRHEFSYKENWLNAEASRPLSLSMPLRPPEAPYKGDVVENWFDNLLPDSTAIRRRVQMRFGTRSTGAFDLLEEIGRDCAGAVQLLATELPPPEVKRIDGDPLGEKDVAQVLRNTVTTPAFGQADNEEFRISLAGAQEKTGLLWHEGQWHRPLGTTPTTHIFKLPLGIVGNIQADLSTSVENEWLCAKIVAAYGMPVAKCEMSCFEDQRVLVVERFDRRKAPDAQWWLRLPQEDMCQALGKPGGHRYEVDGGPGIIEIMSLLFGAKNAAADRRTFFKAQVLFWMLAAIDGHAKNFSVLIEPEGRFSLTPLYDVLSAYPFMGNGNGQLSPQKTKMAMAVIGENRHYRWQTILRRHWQSTAAHADFASEIEGVIAELVEQTPRVLDEIANILPADFPDNVAAPILEGLGNAATALTA